MVKYYFREHILALEFRSTLKKKLYNWDKLKRYIVRAHKFQTKEPETVAWIKVLRVK
jgi:hypothetical protein